MKGYKFREGEEVCHKDNVKLKMIVMEILKKTVSPKTTEKLPKMDIVDNLEKKIFVIGIKCHWWNGDKLEKEKFHSRELVPYNLAQDPKQLKVWLDS